MRMARIWIEGMNMKETNAANPSQLRGVKQYLRYNYWSLSPRPLRERKSRRNILSSLRERISVTPPLAAWFEAFMRIGRRGVFESRTSQKHAIKR